MEASCTVQTLRNSCKFLSESDKKKLAREISKNQVSDPGPSWPSCFKFTLTCCLQFFSIWISLKFCRLVMVLHNPKFSRDLGKKPKLENNVGKVTSSFFFFCFFFCFCFFCFLFLFSFSHIVFRTFKVCFHQLIHIMV